MVGFTRTLGKIGHMLPQYAECLNADLGFTTHSDGLTGLLTVGLISGAPGEVITSYVIEWHLNSTSGPIVLLSGYNAQETVNVSHPFENQYVQSGNLYAVVKYIVINGIKYSPYFRLGQFSPDLKICFNYITVNSVTCGNGTTGTYSHVFNYNNNTDPAEKADREITFYLDENINFVAWKFSAYIIVDEIKIWYISALTPDNPILCTNWRVGTGTTTNVMASPKVWGSNNGGQGSYLQQVIDLRSKSAFTIGDYLLIRIIPRVLQPTELNTNWNLQLKCLSTFADYVPPANCRILDVSSVRTSENVAACTYTFYFKLLGRYETPSHWNNYMQQESVASNAGFYKGNYNSGTGEYSYTASKNVTAGLLSLYNITTCIRYSGTITYKKVGGIITLIFSHQTDYDRNKSRYETSIANSNWTNYSPDNTNINYYKFITLNSTQGISCGDITSSKSYYIYKTSIFTWDNVNKTVTINLTTATNGYVSGPTCDNVHTSLDGTINAITNTLSVADFEYTTDIGPTDIFNFYSRTVFQPSFTSTYFITGSYLLGTGYPTQWSPATNALCEGLVPTEWESYTNSGIGSLFGYVTGERKLTVTNPSDPLNNFKIENYQNSTTGDKLTTAVLEYEIVNGIRTYPPL